MTSFDIDYKTLRNKIRYLIFKEQATEIYVTEDFNIFGFKLRGIEQTDSLVLTNRNEVNLTEEELIQIHGEGNVINLHFTDLDVAMIYIPKSLYQDRVIHEDMTKYVVDRIESEIENSEIYHMPEISLNSYDAKQLEEDVEFFIPSLQRNGVMKKFKMNYAIWSPKWI